MAVWKNKLLVADIWKAVTNGLMTPTDAGKGFANRLRAFNFPDDGWIEIIIDNFDDIEDADNFDEVLNDLYDWSDEDHKLWVDRWKSPEVVAHIK